MTETQMVRIPTPGPDKKPLSKAQKEFNRLTKKIDELELELNSFRTAANSVQQRVNSEYVPLLHEYNEHRVSLVQVFDRAHDRPGTTKTERKKLANIIIDLTFDLISQHEMEELKPIFDKYNDEGFDTVDAEADGQISEVMKEMMTSMYGITFDDDVDVSTQAKFMAYIEEQMQARHASGEPFGPTNGRSQTAPGDDPNQARTGKSAKPKSAKQQEREAKKQLEERNITKAVRTLYMDLVKAFHPDREPDEAEKARKTGIMQRITEAYEKSDLLALFRLQLEYDRIDQAHLETLAEDQLKYYNKILKQQAEELGQELYGLQSQLSAALGKSLMMVGSALGLEMAFKNDIRDLKRSIKDVKRDVKDLADPVYLKAWLKTYKIQKPDDFGSFEVLFR